MTLILKASASDRCSLEMPNINAHPGYAPESVLQPEHASPESSDKFADMNGHSCTRIEPFALLGNTKEAKNTVKEVLARLPKASIVQDAYLCTSLQEGLMALSMKQPGKFMPQLIYKLPLSLDVESFKAAWQVTVNSNTSLRTTIVQTSLSDLIQVVLANHQIDWHTSNSLVDYLKVDGQKPIDLGSALFRYAIIEDLVSGLKHFVWTIHHALVDGWSIRLLLKQVDQRYRKIHVNALVPLNRFIAYIMQLDKQKAKSFWSQQLSGITSKQFPAFPSTGYSPVPNCSLTRHIQIPEELKALATAPTIIQAAWALLLRRYTCSNDITFGVVLSGRNIEVSNIANVNGLTLTTVPMRIIIDPEQAVSEYLTAIREAKLKMKPYQHTGLQNIRKFGMDCASACDFQNLLVVQPRIEEDQDSVFRDRDNPSNHWGNLNAYSLMLQCNLTHDGFTAMANFDTGTITEEQMERILPEFEFLIIQMHLNCNGPISNVRMSMKDSHDAQTYIAESQTIESSVHDLIKKHTSEHPNAVAICSWDGDLSYQELDLLSLRLAHRLRCSNVGPEVMVALFFEKSLWAIVAMMAVMKAGGVFVPLDPSHPSERLKSLIQEVGAGLLLCSEKHADYSYGMSDEVIVVGTASLQKFSLNEPTLPKVHPKDGIYVIFTSGSTGKPKGCVLDHSACCSSIVRLAESFGMNSSSRVLQFSSYCFDACIVEIFATLLVGGCVCVPSEEMRLNSIVDYINDKKVNFAFLTPSFSRIINPESLPHLETLVLIGEKVAREDINRWFGKLRLFNGYGPTECCVICVVNEFTEQDSVPNQIGRGIVGAFVVVNDAGEIAPAHATGELYIGGPTLARGYLNDFEKTAAAFRDDAPWAFNSDHVIKRFYKTGDLVKMRPNGFIEYLGRRDTQVKLRGQRIELGEVEHHLSQTLAEVVDLAVEVVTPANDLSNPVLAAFISLNYEQYDNRLSVERTFTPREPLNPEISSRIWDNLSMSLPRYMVPSLLIPLKAIPLSSSGKINRQKLRSIVANLTMEELITYSSDHREKSVPVTENEKVLHRLWARILDIKPDMIGRNDNFIRLGGDSILAMKLVAASREKGLALSVADVFRSPRLCDLGMIVTGIDDPSAGDDTTPPPFTLVGGVEKAEHFYPEAISQCNIRASEIEDIYPCTPFQEGIMTLSAKQPGAYIAQHRFELLPDLNLDLEKVCLAWERVVNINPILRTRIFHSDRAGLMQVIVKEPIQWLYEDDLDDYFRKNKQCSMSFGSPLSQYAIVTPAPGKNDKQYLVWTTHHAIYDGWSIALILKQIDQQYQLLRSENLLQGALIEPSSQPWKFNTFVKALQDYDIHASETFWRKQFMDGEPKTFPQVQSNSLCLPNASLESKVQISCEGNSDLTISTIIRAAWAVIISKYANSNDIVFGATLSGRTGSIAEVEKIVGPIATTVPVRISLDPFRPISDFLREVEAQALDMTPFEQLGLANIRRINSNTKIACDFQNLLIIQPKTETDVDGTFLGKHISTHVGVFDTYALTMECSLNEEGLVAKMIFDPHVLSETEIERMMFQFKHVLRQLCIKGKEDLLRDIETVSPEDYETMWKWNATLPDMIESCVHSLIEQRMLEEPDAQAVCAWDGDLSYSELSIMSSRLAHHLIGMGVGPEIIVPILFDKSKWVVVVILGILKAGGAFVPLEPSHPPARLVSIVDQLNAAILLCSPEHIKMCRKEFPKCNILVLNKLEFARISDTTSTPDVEVTSKNAAYVVYTSGTTGTPKGIVIEHGAYCSSAGDHSQALRFDRTSRHLQFASHSFDTSIEDILTTLLTGGCICIPSEAERNQDLVGAINRMNVTKADLTPSFLSHIEPHDVQNLKVLILGGEPLTTKIIKAWANHVRMINAYGISECSVTNLVNADISPDTDPANIGRAVGGACWIVDSGDHDKLAAVGTVGELVIEGPTLARGYLDDETRTRTAFINAPTWAREKNGIRRPQRLYKTGDLVQYTSDGSISYIGRKDTQVKIRGQRVELHDVERHLMDHPHLESAVVLLPNSGPYMNALTAVIQPRSMTCSSNSKDIEFITKSRLNEMGLKWSELSTYLNERVPKYMIPQKWVALKNIPLHVTKKLDRSKIASWLAHLSNEQDLVDEITANESSPLAADEIVAMAISHKIADLVLESSVSGHDARLSAIGIDSIRMTSLAAFIKRTFGVSITMQKLINCQTTIRDISKHILDAKIGIETQAIARLDLMNEFSLLNSRLNFSQKPRLHLSAVFLTGATGFLGTQILRQLLYRSDVGKVIAHVRADSPEHGKQRIIASAQVAKWWSDTLEPKLEIWIGDLARPRLGLTSHQWGSLSTLDAIIHNGAAVQWNADYYALKPANVISTLELLSIVTTPNCHPQPRFVYVSGGRYVEDDMSEFDAAELLSSVEGYSQTKFVSELLVKQFVQGPGADAHRIHIVKPGLIIGTAEEGVANKNDFLWRFVAGALTVGGFPLPQDGDDWLLVASADHVAAAAIDCLVGCNKKARAGVVSIREGIPLQQLWTILNDNMGYELLPMSHNQWIRKLQKDLEASTENHPLWPVMHLLKEGNFASRRPKLEVSKEAVDLTRAAIQKNVEFLIDEGFLKKPALLASSKA